MQENDRRLGAARLAFVVVLVLTASSTQAQGPLAAGVTPSTAAAGSLPLLSHSLSGIKNFGQVTPRLYRGAQPAEKGYDLLAKMGVQIVIDFREEKDQIERERRAIESRHIQFVSIPWSPWHDPTAEQVQQFFDVLRSNPDKRLFVHCEVGADRTGALVALYRIAGQQWKISDAVREMHAYHYHAFWFPHLARYVEKFPQQLESDPALRGAVVPQPRPASP